MEGLGRFIYARRKRVIAVWLVLTVFGGYSAGQVSKRWFQSFSIPGYSAYEAGQRIRHTYGNGEVLPLIVSVHADGDVTKEPGAAKAIAAAVAATPGSRAASFFSTNDPVFVSKDRHTTFAEIYPPGAESFSFKSPEKRMRAAATAVAGGLRVHVTGYEVLVAAAGGAHGPSVLTEALIGGVGALVILLFVFGTLPAVAMPLMIAVASILNTFTLVWILTYVTDVSIIVQFLIALVGLGVAIDYALLMIFRFREELRHGLDTEAAVLVTMKHAGRSVIVSGSTVAGGLLSMIVLPLPFIRSIGIGGMLIPTVSVIASITLLPAMLSVLGPRINRMRVMPKRIVEGTDAERGFWNAWARTVVRRPVVVAAAGLAIVAVLVAFGLRLNPAQAQAKDLPGGGDPVAGRTALAQAGISAGAYEPFEILVENGSPGLADEVAAAVRRVPGIVGAVAPKDWRRGEAAIVDAIPAYDSESKAARSLISHLKDDTLPPLARNGASVTLTGPAPVNRDFVHAVYGNFPFVLLFVVLLTYVLLARAFRSLVLPAKAVLLNLVSLAAAFGIIVFIFQQGHGSEAIWGVHATESIIPWIPLMIFAFLYGLSMDYEVFMLTRMREAYDHSGDTSEAIRLGLARTGKLVTSAALVLCLAFFVLSTSPGTDVKQFGIGLAAGIIFDATVIRALLVPSLMRLLGRWNWWFPRPVAKALLADAPPAPDAA